VLTTPHDEHLVTRTRTASGHDILFSHAPESMVAFVGAGRQVVTGRLERLRILLMLARPRTCVPGLIAFALGYSYTGGGFSAAFLLGALLAFSIGLSANLHNAAIDLHEDSRNLPGRVWLLAKLGHRPLLVACRAIAVLMMLGGIALGWYFTVFMALAVVGLHQYSAPPVRSKGRPLLGIWVFAQAVVFPFLFGWTTHPGRLFETLLLSIGAHAGFGALPPAAEAWQSWRYLGMWAFMTLWFMAKGTFKNVPDYAGDSAAGLRTSATVFKSRREAAVVASVATLCAYASLAALWAVGLETGRAMLSFLWLGPVAYNCLRLVRSRDGAAANAVLRTDMAISSGFIATLALLVAPTAVTAGVVGTAAVVFFASDLLGIDSRREADTQAGTRPAQENSGPSSG
jgi:4-hydroxybenzoate polyprenyltransferase